MKQRIACIGNTNHFMLNLVRFLREDNFDAHLLLLKEPDVFQPGMDCFNEGYKNYTRQLDWKNKPFYEVSKESILEDLKEFDYIIGCDGSPAFVHKAGRKMDIFVPFGEDLYGLPFNTRKLKFSINPKKMYSNIIWNKRHNEYPLSQKAGILKARNTFMPPTNPDFEKITLKLGIKNRKPIECPSVYTTDYNVQSIKDFYKISEQYKFFKELRDNSEILVFHHSRHLWTGHEDVWSDKANDLVFYALSKFKKSYPDVKLNVLLCEYGPDVQASKDLIRKLDVEDMVKWFPKLPRKEIMVGLSMADAGIGELAFSWLGYTALNEFMAMGIPVAHKRNDSDFLDYHDHLYPMHHASSTEEIFTFYDALLNKKEAMKKMGEDAREWYLNKVVKVSLNAFKKELSTVKKMSNGK